MVRGDKKLYFVAAALESREQRILYSVDIRDGIMMLSEKMVRGRSGATSLISEKELRRVTLSSELIVFEGNAESTSRALIAAFTSFVRAQGCYSTLDVQKLDSRWATETVQVLEFFKKPIGTECAFGPMELALN